MQTKFLILGLISSLFFVNQTQALTTECSAKTGSTTTPLLELYTSEGCSSCPPADQWISQLKQSKDQIIPLVFHVDYWDYIGWKDKFAKAAYSDRQRETAAFNGTGFVYTPQFVLNGRDFKRWNNHRLSNAIHHTQKLASRIDLTLKAINETDGRITLKTHAASLNLNETNNAAVFVALYENGLVTQVKAGENNGRELKHDYVVRQLLGAYQLDNRNQFSKNFILNDTWRNKDAGAVIFVQNSANGEIIQSLALPFCPNPDSQ